MVVSTSILKDTIFFVKEFLSGNVTDPISNRPTNEKFVMTSYPQRPVTYPFITVKDLNTDSRMTLGFQSEAAQVNLQMEVRVWASNIAQRDKIADEIFDEMRLNQIGTVGTSQANSLHDLRLLNSVNVDEPDGPKSKVMTYKFMFIAE